MDFFIGLITFFSLSDLQEVTLTKKPLRSSQYNNKNYFTFTTKSIPPKEKSDAQAISSLVTKRI